jgi:hypothetical protein
MGRTLLALALLLAAGGAGYALRCRGPRPEVLEARVRGGHAAATVRNRGPEGGVEVRFRAVERRTGARVAAETSAQLGEGEEVEVVAPAPLPPGDWEVTAEAEFPPR